MSSATESTGSAAGTTSTFIDWPASAAGARSFSTSYGILSNSDGLMVMLPAAPNSSV